MNVLQDISFMESERGVIQPEIRIYATHLFSFLLSRRIVTTQITNCVCDLC